MTTQAQPDWATGLIDLLDQQRQVYAKLDALSAEQGDLVAAGDAEPLLNILGQRQSLVDQLTQLNSRIEPYKQNWPALWAQLDAATQSKIQGLIDQVQSMLDAIVERDERDRNALSKQRDDVADQIHGANRGTAVHKAYGTAAQTVAPRFTDHAG